jgi:uroporphyrinogen-III synthase
MGTRPATWPAYCQIPAELDADVILAATALELASQASDVIVATSTSALAQFVDAAGRPSP